MDEIEAKKLRHQLKLLYLEEEADTRRITTSMLRRHYGEVVAAARGDEAIEILFRYRPHVIVSEVALRDGNLSDFLSEIKEKASNVPFVILTSMPGLVPKNQMRGVILKKPVKDEQLVTAIDRVTFDP